MLELSISVVAFDDFRWNNSLDGRKSTFEDGIAKRPRPGFTGTGESEEKAGKLSDTPTRKRESLQRFEVNHIFKSKYNLILFVALYIMWEKFCSWCWTLLQHFSFLIPIAHFNLELHGFISSQSLAQSIEKCFFKYANTHGRCF